MSLPENTDNVLFIKQIDNQITVTCRNGNAIENPIIENCVLPVECFPNYCPFCGETNG